MHSKCLMIWIMLMTTRTVNGVILSWMRVQSTMVSHLIFQARFYFWFYFRLYFRFDIETVVWKPRKALCCGETLLNDPESFGSCLEQKEIKCWDVGWGPNSRCGDGQYGNDSLPCCECRLVATRDISARVPYTQAPFLTWLPLVAVLIVISFVITTRRKSDKTNCCRGFFGFPDAINMLDNERTRWINASLFFVMGWQLTLMILDASLVDVPYYFFKSPEFPFIFKKLLIIAYYLVIFAPIVMGLPRYDLYGSVMVRLKSIEPKQSLKALRLELNFRQCYILGW